MNDLTEQEISAFVGPKADYYLQRWLPAADGSGRVRGVNWAAFLLSGFWLPYRKMYRATAIFFGVFVLEVILVEVILLEVVLGYPEAPGYIGRILGFVVSLVCGGYANDWYLSHARKSIVELRNLGLPEEAYFAALAKKGGTSLAASLGSWVLFLLAIFVPLFWLEVLLNVLA